MRGVARRRDVTDEPADTLPPEAELALAWSSASLRGPLSMALQLDRRLARIVARTREPVLGQMRLAWWREALGKPPADRPRGDAVLDGIGEHWAGREPPLVALVDAWEVLVTAERLGPVEAASFATGRGMFFAGLAGEGATADLHERLLAAGRCWALADAAAGVSDAGERAVLVTAGLAAAAQAGRAGRLPGHWRGLAVLEALARRGLERGGQPLLQGRAAPLVALRAAIFRA